MSFGPTFQQILRRVFKSGAPDTESLRVNVENFADISVVTDALEDLLTQIRDNADELEGFTDGLEGLITATNTLLTTIRDNADDLEGFTDGIEGLITAGNALLTSINTQAIAINANTDTLESLVSTTNATLLAIQGFVDGVETLLSAINSNTDGIEALIGISNTLLTDISGFVDGLEGFVDGLETLITATNTKLDTANASLASIDAGIPAALGQTLMAAAMPVVIASNQTPVNNFFATSTHTRPTVTTTSSTILALNTARRWARIQNNDNRTIWIEYTIAAVVNQCIPIAPGEFHRIDATNLFTGAITAIVSTSTAVPEVWEGVA